MAKRGRPPKLPEDRRKDTNILLSAKERAEIENARGIVGENFVHFVREAALVKARNINNKNLITIQTLLEKELNMNEKKYYIEQNDNEGITLCRVVDSENYSERVIPDCLPDFVQAEMEDAESGATTYYAGDGYEYDEMPTESEFPNAILTIKVVWSPSTCKTYEITRFGEHDLFTHEGVYSYAEIIDIVGGEDLLSEEYKKFFVENGETVEDCD